MTCLAFWRGGGGGGGRLLPCQSDLAVFAEFLDEQGYNMLDCSQAYYV